MRKIQTYLHEFADKLKNNNVKNKKREMRKEHKRLSAQKIFIDDFITSEYDENQEFCTLVSVSFNNPKVIEYQIKLIKKFLKGNYLYIVCDNSNKEDSAKLIKQVCVDNNITYIRVNSKIVPNGYSDSHGVALNWIWETILKTRKKNFALLDHDIMPIVEQDIESYFYQDVWGPKHCFDKKPNLKWYIWPGFTFVKYSAVEGLKLNFRRYRQFGFIKVNAADTGSANWKQLYAKYPVSEMDWCQISLCNIHNDEDIIIRNQEQVFDDVVQYLNNKTWTHCYNGSGWAGTRTKTDLFYQKLDRYLEL